MTNWIDLFKGALGLDADKKAQAVREGVVSKVRGVVAEMSQAVNAIDKRMSLALVHYGKSETVQIVVSRNGVALGTCVSIALDKSKGWPLHVMSAGDTKLHNIENFEFFMKDIVNAKDKDGKQSKLIEMLKETMMPEKEAESLNYTIPTAAERAKLTMSEKQPDGAVPALLNAPDKETDPLDLEGGDMSGDVDDN